MDRKTVDTYDSNASTFSARHQSCTPYRLYNLATTFFHAGAPTVDIGSGIGRDTEWLTENGFPCQGIEPSAGMVREAQRLYGERTFHADALPTLHTIEDNTYANVFVCAVLMHVPRSELIAAIINLLRITAPSGRLIVAFRHGQDENDGRLFENYHPGQIAHCFESLGGKVLHLENDGIWHNLVVEKIDLTNKCGIAQIQEIITRDRKTATYKFALLRALCEISRYETHAVAWDRNRDVVFVPMKRIAVRWIGYYLPLMKAGIKQTTSKRVAFEQEMMALDFSAKDLSLIRTLIDRGESAALTTLLKKLAHAIEVGPVQFAGGGSYEIFSFLSRTKAAHLSAAIERDLGLVAVPIPLWRDLCLFSHWIEDSLVVQWAEFTEKLNPNKSFAQCLDLITKATQEDERHTAIIRKLFERNETLECVWTGRKLTAFAVDHMVPWALWRNNDIWNLLPSHAKTNSQKSDDLPSPGLVRRRFDAIRRYWSRYAEAYPLLFERQVHMGLGISGTEALTPHGLEAIEAVILRVHRTIGGRFWDVR